MHANDWIKLSDADLLTRVLPKGFDDVNSLKYCKGSKEFSDIRNLSGEIMGRCSLPFYPSNTALGVTHGILSGYVNGMTGVIFTYAQQDLARQTAIPRITKFELQTWANCQAEIITNLGNFNIEDSARLANYGARYEKLAIGMMGGKSLLFGELVTHLIQYGELIVTDDEFTYDEDDPCDFDQFDVFFEQSGKVFYFHNLDYIKPAWVDDLPGTPNESNYWGLEHAFIAALNKAWGENWVLETQLVQVGVVGTCPILRECDVYKRIN